MGDSWGRKNLSKLILALMPTQLQLSTNLRILLSLDRVLYLFDSNDNKQSSIATVLTHLDNIMPYQKHRITNATAEGFNSKIQSIKSATRGFKNFENYRVSILFPCGKLNLYLQGSQ